jgi:hypothetical protein
MLRIGLIVIFIVYINSCYLSCGGCNSQGDINNNQCTSCANNYYPLSDASNMCFSKTDMAIPKNYFFSTDVFTKCYPSCGTCSKVGYSVTHNCNSCAATYYSLSDNISMCYQQGDPSLPSYYVFNDNQFKRCYVSCNSCNATGTDLAHNCLSCAENYFPLSDDHTRCYQWGSQSVPTNYIFQTNIFQKCYNACATCSALGSSANMYCLTCAAGYYRLSDLASMCYQQGDPSIPVNYIFQVNIFQKCYPGCATCTAGGNKTIMNCSICANSYYPLFDNTTKCYQNLNSSDPLPPSNYVLIDNVFKKCYSACDSCAKIGDSTIMNCSKCANGFYPLSDNNSQCYQNTTDSGVPSNYVFISNAFVKCFGSCGTCSDAGTQTSMNCLTCSNSFYPLSDKHSLCYQEGDTHIPPNYIFISNIFQHCYQSCGTCSNIGTDNTNMNCLTCAESYYPLSDDNTKCFQSNDNSGVPSNYVFSTDKFIKCHHACTTCSSAGDDTATHCLTCNANYYPLSDNTSMCYLNQDPNIPSYYILQNNVFVRCHQSCKTCSSPADDNSFNCTDCAQNYFPLSTDSKQCYQNVTNNGAPLNYIFVLSGLNFQPCYEACSSCAEVGTPDLMKCKSCSTDYFPLSDNNELCYKQDSQQVPANYIIVNNIFQKCFTSCSTCSAAGDANNHNCRICDTSNNYFPLSDKASMCFQNADNSGVPPNYIFKDIIFEKCFESCATCSDMSNNPTSQNCLTCSKDYYNIDGDISNCYKQGDSNIPSGYIYDCVQTYVQGECYASCNECTCVGTQITMNCKNCKEGFYILSDQVSQCWEDTNVDRPQNYVLINNELQKCWKSCGTCKDIAVGTEAVQNCLSCAINYFPLSDDSSLCYLENDTSRPNNYVFNPQSGKHEKCYSSCATCNLGSDSTNHNCIQCALDNYKLPDKTLQCYTSDNKPDNYLFINNEFVKCYLGCSKCSAAPTDNLQNCSSCAENYFPLTDDTTKCFLVNDTALPSNYTFDSISQTFVHCYENCNTCSAPGNLDSMNCKICKDTYYPLQDLTSQCYLKDDSNVPSGYTFDCNNLFLKQACYTSCATCSCIDTQSQMNCKACADGFYPMEDALSQCWKDEDSNRPQKYVLNNQTFVKCFENCTSCTAIGSIDNQFCKTCADGYYPLSDKPSQCYLENDTNRPENYIFDINKHDKCYEGCKKCELGSSAMTHKCLSCADKYFPLSDQASQCYLQSDPQRPPNYIFQTNIHNKCYDSCKTCTDLGDLNKQNCKSCSDLFYPLYDKVSQCFSESDVNLPKGYYLNTTSNQFEACYTSCSTCSSAGSSSDNQNCLICKKEYFPLENDPSKCFKIGDSDLPSGYTFNCNNLFTNTGCYESCNTCSCTGIYNKMNCISCKTDYYPLVDNLSQCFKDDDIKRPQNYVLISDKFQKCFANCSGCSDLGNQQQMNCKSCIKDFFPLEDNITQCYTPDDVNRPHNYYYNSTKLSKCWESCDTCSTSGDASKHNCTKCADGYYRLSDNITQCFKSDSPDLPANYVLNSGEWQRCYIGCTACTAVGNIDGQNCKVCASTYYPLEDKATQCYQQNDTNLPMGYTFNTVNFIKCYISCASCSNSGDINKNNCTKCSDGYYPLSTDNTMCYSNMDVNLPTGFVFDCLNKVFIQGSCYTSCKTCNCIGDKDNHSCVKCTDSYYPLEDKMTMCYLVTDTDRPVNYIYQLNLFKKCHPACATCSNIANEITMNCNTCSTDYYPLVDSPSNCYKQDDQLRPQGYYFATDKFVKCYKSCGACDKAGDINNHNCGKCNVSFYPLDSDASKCFEKLDSNLPANLALDPISLTFKTFSTSCFERCATCTSMGNYTSHQCVTCKSNFYAVENLYGTCYNSSDTNLITQYYLIGDIYKKCYIGCDGCTGGYSFPNEHNCKKCNTNYYPLSIDQTKCFKAPLTGYYLKDKLWNNCPEGCLECSSANSCTSCVPEYYHDFTNNKCYNICPIGLYPDNTQMQCLPCHPSCKQCSDSLTCTSCNDKYYSVLPGQLCGACLSTCATCINNSQCLTCFNDGFFSNYQCLDACPDGFYGDKDHNTCKPCLSPCNNCLSETSCLDCIAGYTKTGSACIQNSCTTSQYYDTDKNQCIDCPSSCATCINGSLCNTCKEELIYNYGECVKNCPAGTWFNAKDNICQKCSTLCEECLNSTEFCKICSGNTFGYNQPVGVDNITRQCVKECPKNLYPDPATKLCKSCSDLKWVFYQGACVQQCPSGLIPDTNKNCIDPDKQKITKCDINPCINGGICTAGVSGFTCTCTAGFYGQLCHLVFNKGKITFNSLGTAINLTNSFDSSKLATNDQLMQLKALALNVSNLPTDTQSNLLNIFDSQIRLTMALGNNIDEAMVPSAISVLKANLSQ